MVVVAYTLAVAAQESKSANPGVEDETAIREKLKQMNDGWKARDAGLFAKPFATDADYVVVNGTRLRGRKAIEEGHRHFFRMIPKEDPTEAESVRQEMTIRLLRPDVALVHTVGFGTVHNIATLVLTRGAQGWEIAALQRTEIQAQPAGRPNR
jgi:uncharacterized protein (TIGR02246 family)